MDIQSNIGWSKYNQGKFVFSELVSHESKSADLVMRQEIIDNTINKLDVYTFANSMSYRLELCKTVITPELYELDYYCRNYNTPNFTEVLEFEFLKDNLLSAISYLESSRFIVSNNKVKSQLLQNEIDSLKLQILENGISNALILRLKKVVIKMRQLVTAFLKTSQKTIKHFRKKLITIRIQDMRKIYRSIFHFTFKLLNSFSGSVDEEEVFISNQLNRHLFQRKIIIYKLCIIKSFLSAQLTSSLATLTTDSPHRKETNY